MKKLIESIFISIVLTMVLFSVSLFMNDAWSRDFHLVDVDELSVDYKNYKMLNPSARHALIYPEHPKEGLNLNLNTNVLNFIYWNNTIEALTTDSQYRSIGLQLGLGVRVTNFLEVGFHHHSEHLIDRHHSFMEKFPVTDALHIKLFLIRTDKKKSIF